MEITKKMVYNRLWGHIVYECGPMDRAPDGGIGWRADITPFLESRGMIVLDPCNKPIDIGCEDVESRQYREQLKQDNKYDELANSIRIIRSVDLRCVDFCDFIIVHLDNEIVPCGTLEELFWANRLKRPILIHIQQGKQNVSDWLLGVTNHQLIFDTWQELKDYIVHVDEDEDVETYKRWYFFNKQKMMPKVPPKFDTDWRPW